MVKISANMNSFQDVRNCKMAPVARPGFASGNTMTKNVRKNPAPSMQAASSSSLGMLWK